MDAHEIRRLLTDVRAGRLSRRAFTGSMLALGLTAPLAAQMLAAAGVALAQPRGETFNPTRRGVVASVFYSRSRVLHEPVHLVGGRVEGEQVAGAQRHALAQRGVRSDLPGGGGRT